MSEPAPEVAEEQKPPREKIQLVFKGRQPHDKKVKQFVWFVLKNAAENDGRRFKIQTADFKIFEKKNIVTAQPGVVIEIEAKDKSVYPSTARIIDYWHNQDDVLEWQLDHRAVGTNEEMKSKAVTKLDGVLSEAIAPVRMAYQATHQTRQAAVLAYIIREITKYVPGEEKRRREKDENYF